MATYYVSPTGSNSNNGSSSLPWQTLQFAQAQLHAGDTLMLNDGTYDQSSTTYGYLYMTTIGTIGNPITWKSINPLGAKITSAGIGVPTVAVYNQGDYIVWDGIDFTTTSGSTALECNANHCILKNSYIHDVPGTFTGSAVTFGTGFIDNWAINCIVDHIGFSGGNQVQGIYMSSSGGGIWNCRVSRVAGWGLHLWHSADNCLVLNNISYNNGSGGVLVGNDGLISGHTIGQGSVVANNIIYGNTGFGIREAGSVGTMGLNTYSNNCFWQNTLGNAGLFIGTTSVVNSINANPQFINYQPDNTGDYHLSSSSPCISVGMDVSGYGLTYDLDMKTRPQIGGYDIGPYEYGSSVHVMMPIA